RDIKCAGDAQYHTRLRSPEQISECEQWRLIEPDAAVKHAAAHHLAGGSQGQTFFRPKNAAVREPGDCCQHQQQGEEEDRFAHYGAASAFASRRSSTRRNSSPYTGSASANST